MNILNTEQEFSVITKTAENTVTLEWEHIDGADGYRVFSCDHKTNKFRGVENTAENTLTIKNLPNGVISDYKIKAFRIPDGPDNFFMTSEIVSACPMATPTGLRSTQNVSGDVILMWDFVDDNDGYKVYKRVKDTGEFAQACYCEKGVVSITGLESNVTYEFKVRSFRLVNGVEKLSKFSEETEVTISQKIIKLSETFVSMKSGDSKEIACTFQGEPSKVSWKSDNSEVALVENGIIKAIGKGRANVTAFGELGSANVAVVVDRTQENLHPILPQRFTPKGDKLVKRNKTAELLLTGDLCCSIGMQLATNRDKFAFDKMLKLVKETAENADFILGSLDTQITDLLPTTFERSDIKNAPITFLDALRYAEVDGVVNWGDEDKKVASDTAKKLADYKLLQFNADSSVSVVRINSINIGIICIDGAAEIIPLRQIQAAISSAKENGAEYLLAYINWGSINTIMVRQSQREIAQRIVDCGADFIVGCGVGALQELDILTDRNNREVPVAYSLGKATTADYNTRFDRLNALLSLKISRENDVIHCDYCYIPCYVSDYCAVGSYVNIPLVESNKSYLSYTDFMDRKNSIRDIIGEKVRFCENSPVSDEKIKIALYGSSLLGNAFKNCSDYDIDKSHLFISQLAICGEKQEVADKYTNNIINPVYYNLTKGFDEYVAEEKSDFVIVDMYYLATTPLFELNGIVYSGGEAFKNSLFYLENKDNFNKINLCELSDWQKYLDGFISALKSNYHSQQIILVKISEPKYYAVKDKLKIGSDNNLNSAFLHLAEDYFIAEALPVIIDIAGYYCGNAYNMHGFFAIAYESDFYTHFKNCIREIVSAKYITKSVYNEKDTALWLSRIVRYYDSIFANGYQNDFLATMNPVDYFISNTNKEFISSNFKTFVKLKNSNISQFIEVFRDFDFDGNEEFRKAIYAVNEVRKHVYDNENADYELLFKHDFRIVDTLCNEISDKLYDLNILENAVIPKCDAPFYFKCMQMLLSGENKLAVKQLVQAYYEKHKPIKIDIWGSKLSQQAIADSNKVTTGNIVSECPFICEFASEVDINYSIFSGGNKDKLFSAMKRSIHNCLDNTENQWVIVDFASICMDFYKHKNSIFQGIENIQKNSAFKMLQAECSKFNLYENNGFDEHLFETEMQKYADYLLEKYGENIILMRINYNLNYIDIDGVIRPFKDKTTISKNRLIEKCEDMFIKLTNCYVLEYTRLFMADETAQNGRAQADNFEDMFYTSAKNAIEQIVETKPEQKVFRKLDLLNQFKRVESIKKNNPQLTNEDLEILLGDKGIVKLFAE